MEELITQVLPLWGIEIRQLTQIYSSAWELNHSYVIKVYHDQDQLERNIRISALLIDCHIPVARIIPTKTGDKYAQYQNIYFQMSEKLQGSNIFDRNDSELIRKMGRAIAQLHAAFLKCEQEIEFWDNSLLLEMKGWVRENLNDNAWQIITETEYSKTVGLLEKLYDYLPKQLIHRDVHFGNFLFLNGSFSGYIDFDLSQKNIRIFDICYFLTGLLSEEIDQPLSKSEWLNTVKSVIAGYESITKLSYEEKDAVPCVMECIEILCAAHFISTKDVKHADDACRVFHLIQSYESDIKNAL